MKDDILLSEVIEYNKSRYYSFKNNIPFEYNNNFDKILNARYHKISRIKKRLIWLFLTKKYVWFCTFTFDDNIIKKSDRTKKDLIKKCLKVYDFKYILNVDFGKKTEREHYHCIIGTDNSLNIDKYLKDHYPCFTSALKCNVEINDFNRLSKYINKLTNHCIKESTKNNRIVYNFKGFEALCPTTHDSTLLYKLLLNRFFPCVPLLDKGDTNGKKIDK